MKYLLLCILLTGCVTEKPDTLTKLKALTFGYTMKITDTTLTLSKKRTTFYYAYDNRKDSLIELNYKILLTLMPIDSMYAKAVRQRWTFVD
jgi:hypothetical protein